jgi:hypothetical protein
MVKRSQSNYGQFAADLTETFVFYCTKAQNFAATVRLEPPESPTRKRADNAGQIFQEPKR